MTRARIVMVGPGERSAGGVRSVIAALVASPLAERFTLIEVETHADGSKWRKLAVAARGIARVVALLARDRPDLVYLHTASDASFWRKAIVAGIARIARVGYVVHIHGGGFIDFYRDSNAPTRLIARRMLRGARGVITLTPSWAREIEAITGRPTTTIPNPVRLPATPADPLATPARVVTLARLGAAKGTYVLLRAFAALAPAHPGARLVLAGDGSPDKALRLAREAGIADRVEIPGWVGPERRDALLDGATIFTLPSRVEGLPVSMLEAMAHGLPVVVTRVGGVPDTIDDGVTGLLVPPDDVAALTAALARLLDDPTAAAAMGSAAREAIDGTYDLDAVAARVGDLIDACIARGR